MDRDLARTSRQRRTAAQSLRIEFCSGTGFFRAQQPFQRRFSAISVLAATVGASPGSCGEVVIIVFDDGSKEMEFTLINCQAEEPDQEVCHHIP